MSADIEQWPPPIDPTAFESLCLDLWKEIWQYSGAQKNGRRGQTQNGVDFVGQQQGHWIGVQCKQKNRLTDKKLTTTELEQEARSARNFYPHLGGFILATTGPRDANVQQLARKLTEEYRRMGLFTVEVWSWDDIWHELYKRETLLKRIAANYWPRLTALRWGNATVYASSRLFRSNRNDSGLIIGRKKEFANLDAAWAGSNRKHVVTILGLGGVGKTSLVASWAASKLAQSDHSGIDRYFDWSFYNQGAPREGDPKGTNPAYADLFLKEALEFFGDATLALSKTSAWQKGERLAQLIGQQRTLLILDGLEPLQSINGELRDQGMQSLLVGLAAHNEGLCLVTTRQSLPELAIWRRSTGPEWALGCLTDKAGSLLLGKLGVKGTDSEKRNLSTQVKGHALTLTLLGGYLRRAHDGDIRRVDRVNLKKVDEKEHGGHAFRVIAAYDRLFKENNCNAELAILRMLGLFDRPVILECLAVLRKPPIANLTDSISSLDEDDWNEAVDHLEELDLIEKRAWEPSYPVGYSEEEAQAALGGDKLDDNPQPTEPRYLTVGNRHCLDAHPLVREFFSAQLKTLSGGQPWTEAHKRIFIYMCNSVPYWPHGLNGLQPLYQAISHGCQAGDYQNALTVYTARIQRSSNGPHGYYSRKKLGAMAADLSALRWFFSTLWIQPVESLSSTDQAWLLNDVAYRLRALGRLIEAREPFLVSLQLRTQQKNWREAALTSSNLSELDLMLGDVAPAVHKGEQSVQIADQSGDLFQRIVNRASFGYALHHAGRRMEASLHFDEAEKLQQERQPDRPKLYSLQGSWFCDFLLAELEQDAWLITLRGGAAPLDRSGDNEQATAGQGVRMGLLRVDGQ